MKAPTIEVDGKKISALAPRMTAWRKLIKIRSADVDFESEEALDLMLDFIADVFNNPKVTPSALEQNVAIEDFFAMFQEAGKWIEHRMNEKMNKIDPGNE